MPAFPTNSLIFFPCACWSEGCFFGHWRSDVTFPLIAGGATRRAVRKHRAPKGALRRLFIEISNSAIRFVRKHRAPKGALRLRISFSSLLASPFVRKHRAPKGALRPMMFSCVGRILFPGQKAPSAKRCIKTEIPRCIASLRIRVRKHRAPKGALRRHAVHCCTVLDVSQKAPSAKRCIKTGCSTSSARGSCGPRQKAPSAKRCIKTGNRLPDDKTDRLVRKHRAPKGALRRGQGH